MPESRTAVALFNPLNQTEWLAYKGPFRVSGIYASCEKKGYVQMWERNEAPAPGTPHPFAMPIHKDVLLDLELSPPGVLFPAGVVVTLSSDPNFYVPLPAAPAYFHVAVYGSAFITRGELGPGTELLGA